MRETQPASPLGPGSLDLTFFKPLNHTSPPSPANSPTKISVIGAGNVGMAISQAILGRGLAQEFVLFDPNPTTIVAKELDLKQAAAFIPPTKIISSSDFSATALSDLCIITAAVELLGESSFNLLESNVTVFQWIVPLLAKFSRPVDILSYLTWKSAGFPSHRVIGSGTNLDSSSFRFADHFGINAHNVQAYIIGEHGNNSVVLWSSISVGGVPS